MAESEKARIKKSKVKLAHYCAYRERTHHEVKNKAIDIGLTYDEADELIAELITENFINEERFAKVYARDKFYLNKWGRNKIILNLKQRKLSEYCIASGMKEIEEDDYLQTIHKLIEKKSQNLREENQFLKNKKIASFLITKGYEAGLVWDLINE